MGTKKEQTRGTFLKPLTELELASIMMDACARYTVHLHNNSKLTKQKWDMVELVAEEIMRRKNAKEEP